MKKRAKIPKHPPPAPSRQFKNVLIVRPVTDQTGFTVSGATDTTLNGHYVRNGSANSYPRYTKGSATIIQATTHWRLQLAGTQKHFARSTAPIPPTTGWTIYGTSTPSITLKYDFT
jgi:hypothetical protein